MKNVAILLISTGKYKQFVKPLLETIDKNFLRNHNITVHIFTDEYNNDLPWGRLKRLKHLIPSYRFPEATLYRYKIFNDHKEWLISYDYLYYLDVDMAIEQEVGDEILNGELVAVRHPGFWHNNGWGSPGNDSRSKSYIFPEFCKKYFAGGFQGGQTGPYLAVCEYLAANIEKDTNMGVLAEWHDETHWNGFLNYGIKIHAPNFEINELNPSYCSVPSLQQRQNWKIDHLPAIIIALNKNHAEMRS